MNYLFWYTKPLKNRNLPNERVDLACVTFITSYEETEKGCCCYKLRAEQEDHSFLRGLIPALYKSSPSFFDPPLFKITTDFKVMGNQLYKNPPDYRGC